MQCSITFSARLLYRPGGGIALHTHPNDWQIQLVYGGRADMRIDGARYAVRTDDLLFIPQGSTHQFQAGEEGLKTLEVKFSVGDRRTGDLLRRIPRATGLRDHAIFDLFTRILSEGQRRRYGYRTMCDLLLEESLVILLRQSDESAGQPSPSPLPGTERDGGNPAIRAVNEYIFRNLDHQFSLSDLAKGCGYNQDYLYRTIKKTYGVSAVGYVNAIRFQQAKRLIEHTELSLSEIAWNLGFDSIQYFSKFFRTRAGVSPSAYSAKMRNAIRIDYP